MQVMWHHMKIAGFAGCIPQARSGLKTWNYPRVPFAFDPYCGGDLSTGSSALADNVEIVATVSDAEFMLRVKEGDEESFAHLRSKHRGPIMFYLCRLVQNRAIAEELAQDVFLRVYRARQDYEPTANFATWLYKIATDVAF